MNYGRYFRLNQALSKVVSGVAIYDYVDLPAYFGPSVDNPMSPKYPINVTITSDTISFRLHYSAFKLEKKSNFVEILKNDGKKRLINKEFPQYAYDGEGINNKSLPKVGESGLTDIGMAHMEEVILDLPFADTSSSRLSDTIKKIYNSTFPQVIDENTSMGGRYLEQLIKKRYPIEKDKESEKGKDSVEDILYRNLRKMSDETVSYSTLWLMDLVRDNRIYLYSKQKIIDDKTKKEKEIDVITGFLRKLLLDFMFDLKHSDVFQNSANYQKMYSGLMSDFFFSALMHKCEYYYYRTLTNHAIEDFEKDKAKLTNQEIKARKDAIATLYANELIKVENLWIQDIMNPQAEKDFEHQYPGKHKFLREIVEYYNFKQWPSWFAEPEEEMRRVCFTMRDETGKKHVCNAETLVKYLNIKSCNQDKSVKEITEIIEDNKEKISKWFLRQYDFNDVLHLHWFKHLNNIFIFVFAIPVLLSLFTREKLWDYNSFKCFLYEVIGIIALTIYVWFVNDFKSMLKSDYWNVREWLGTCKDKLREWGGGLAKPRQWFDCRKKSGVLKARREIVFGNVVWSVLFAVIIAFIIAFRDSECTSYNDWRDIAISYRDCCIKIISSLSWKMWMLIVFGIMWLVILLEKNFNVMKHMISCLHLFFPRLVASITLSWITLSMGFDLYVSYFDYKPSPHYILLIVVVVMLFVMYEINRITPHASPLRKFWRSFELMIISYFISLSVGFLIINFLGPKYLERGGYINDYYDQHVEEKKDGWFERKEKKDRNPFPSSVSFNDSSWQSSANVIYQKLEDINNAVNDTNSHVRLVEGLEKVKMKNKSYSVAAKIVFWGMDIFVLRDFLIMFAFIAMFTGIFIQLIIFGEDKQMTEL